MNTYFITGATGVLGSAIVRELLGMTSAVKLILLIRARDENMLRQRIEWLVKFLNIDATRIVDKVAFIRGDVELGNLGLSRHEFMNLGASVTHIIHSAASVHMNLPLERARRAAVGATENILQLARLCKQNGILKKMEVISTVGVGGRWQGPLPERWITEPRVFHNTYEQSKAEAELVLERHAAKGFPITVHRPSMIVGDSKTGRTPHFQIFYYLIEFVAGRRTWGFLPDLSQKYVDLIPVDFVAQIIVWSSSTPQTTGRILHLCAGSQFATPLRKTRAIAHTKFKEKNILTPKGITLPFFLFKAFCKLIVLISWRKKHSLAVLSIFLDYLQEDQVFDNTDTLRLIESSGFQAPKMDDFLDPVFDYYFDNKYPPQS